MAMKMMIVSRAVVPLLTVLALGLAAANAGVASPVGLARAAETTAAAAAAAGRTVVNDTAAADRLVGKHLLSLQWISWQHFGEALVTDKDGHFFIKGEQRGRAAGKDQETANDFLRLDGRITRIDANRFTFTGEIVTRVSHIAAGAECKRNGTYHFVAHKGRKYWRMAEQDNPCDDVADYVDIYFR